ncbi:MurD UDP-N-acetylmuramoylalanine-D-glutamate ligase [Candidatus Nanopelagicaceae bacterium]
MAIDNPYSSLSERRIVVAGAGVTGMSVARALVERGADVIFADEKVLEVEGFLVKKPELISADSFDYLMVSPGWREDHPLVITARSAGKIILNEVDFAWSLKVEKNPSQKWLALTGTNGKTTTVEMVAHIMTQAGMKVQACGNVGTTVIDSVLSPENFDYLVLELSSFQLHWLKDAQFISSAILNIADDHVDWHGSFDAYASDKISILDKSTTAILNGDDGEVVGRTSHWLGRKIFYSLDTPGPGEIGVVEELLVDRAFVADTQEASLIAELTEIVPTVPHHVSNSLAAAGLASTVGVSREVIREALKTFKPGRHRIELVLERDGITWIDDSKATNPHAAAASIMSHFSVIWIAGGLAKGAQMPPLINRSWSRLKAALLIGEDRNLIADALSNSAPTLPVKMIDPPIGYSKGSESNEFMESIVRAALEIAEPGDVVLLAPACASMDQFNSYSDRGNRFAAAVKKVVGNDN